MEFILMIGLTVGCAKFVIKILNASKIQGLQSGNMLQIKFGELCHEGFEAAFDLFSFL